MNGWCVCAGVAITAYRFSNVCQVAHGRLFQVPITLTE